MSGYSVCCDFDGTVCIPDSCDFLLAKFAPPEWKELDEAVWRGEITEREAFQSQISLLRVTWEEARAALLKGVRIREGFRDFVSFCRARKLPLTILSSGLGELIDVLLQSVGVSGIPVLAHHAEISGDRWRVRLIDLPRLAEYCSHCKCVTVLARKEMGKVIYIGDGYTDLCPTQHADLIFATGRLAQECADLKRPFLPFETFFDIERELEKLIETERDLRR
jgi:2-hydroxy-3-keto-5-methylthiopentenyl-1-phosphate phosphatase